MGRDSFFCYNYGKVGMFAWSRKKGMYLIIFSFDFLQTNNLKMFLILRNCDMYLISLWNIPSKNLSYLISIDLFTVKSLVIQKKTFWRNYLMQTMLPNVFQHYPSMLIHLDWFSSSLRKPFSKFSKYQINMKNYVKNDWQKIEECVTKNNNKRCFYFL